MTISMVPIEVFDALIGTLYKVMVTMVLLSSVVSTPKDHFPNTGLNLCPCTSTKPKPEFVVQSPNLQVAAVGPLPVGDAPSDNKASVYKVSSGHSNNGDNVEAIDKEDLQTSVKPSRKQRKGINLKRLPKPEVVHGAQVHLKA
ncbi:hypothetical protein DFH28DRAFT_451242 [Melampsora americana]|nr:hypothetical protein DFH28DRAFT_451242 [Melampsora americana]